MVALLTALLVLVAVPVAAQDCESRHDQDLNQIDFTAWVERDFTVCFHQNHVGDVELSRWWLIKALRTGREKYGVTRPTYEGTPLHTTLFLTPRETHYARPGYTVNFCCDNEDGAAYAEIHYLTPELWPDWRRYGICWDRMMDYHAHYIFHEMMHTIQASIEGPRDSWTWEALAEFDAYHYSSTWNRERGVEYLLELADYSHRHRIYFAQDLDGGARFLSENEYVGGTVIMMFLRDKFGEGIHNEMLRKEPNEVFRGPQRIDQATLEEFRAWFDGKEALLETHDRCRNSR